MKRLSTADTKAQRAIAQATGLITPAQPPIRRAAP
jgi:hypothetical protein